MAMKTMLHTNMFEYLFSVIEREVIAAFSEPDADSTSSPPNDVHQVCHLLLHEASTPLRGRCWLWLLEAYDKQHNQPDVKESAKQVLSRVCSDTRDISLFFDGLRAIIHACRNPKSVPDVNAVVSKPPALFSSEVAHVSSLTSSNATERYLAYSAFAASSSTSCNSAGAIAQAAQNETDPILRHLAKAALQQVGK